MDKKRGKKRREIIEKRRGKEKKEKKGKNGGKRLPIIAHSSFSSTLHTLSGGGEKEKGRESF